MVKVGDIKEIMVACEIQYTIKIAKSIIQNTSAATKNNHHNKSRTGLPNTLTTGMRTELRTFKNIRRVDVICFSGQMLFQRAGRANEKQCFIGSTR